MSVHEAAVDGHEMARILGVSYDTVIRAARDGVVPSLRIGRLWRFYPTDVRVALSTPTPDLWARPSRGKLRPM